ncbi:MAG: NAD(P)/FAD-dependent oxidoreductase [Propionibacteriales bacterium]|nr:NAD(P)/FAD-dependent oxidoreductase [Propionibacteriales bacterium]
MRDLLVAGGGPVGLATALLADRAGLSVTVVEPRTQPIDKACGEGLMPGAVSALDALGVRPAGRSFRGIRYVADRQQATADFRAGQGLGVRRLALQSSLTAAVSERGIPVLDRAVDTVEDDGRQVRAAGVCARYLAAADGLHSPIRRLLGLDAASRPPVRFGLRQHFAVAPWSQYVEVHWTRDVEAYVTPVDEGLVGVAILTSRREPFDVQLAGVPALRQRLPVSAATSVRGAGPLRQRSTARVCGRVLLVGDAAGYVDALTGEGIAVGVACARALVEAVVADDPASYEASWRAASRRYRWLTESLLWARNHRAAARTIVPGARLLPGVFPTLVNQLAR